MVFATNLEMLTSVPFYIFIVNSVTALNTITMAHVSINLNPAVRYSSSTINNAPCVASMHNSPTWPQSIIMIAVTAVAVDVRDNLMTDDTFWDKNGQL